MKNEKLNKRLRSETHKNTFDKYKNWWLDITNYAKKFFGELIIKAEIELDVRSINREDALAVAKDVDDLIKSVLQKDGNCLETDGTNVRLYFSNGTNIEIWNSEGADLRSFKVIGNVFDNPELLEVYNG